MDKIWLIGDWLISYWKKAVQILKFELPFLVHTLNDICECVTDCVGLS
jgi:hypothetical protein